MISPGTNLQVHRSKMILGPYLYISLALPALGLVADHHIRELRIYRNVVLRDIVRSLYAHIHTHSHHGSYTTAIAKLDTRFSIKDEIDAVIEKHITHETTMDANNFNINIYQYPCILNTDPRNIGRHMGRYIKGCAKKEDITYEEAT